MHSVFAMLVFVDGLPSAIGDRVKWPDPSRSRTRLCFTDAFYYMATHRCDLLTFVRRYPFAAGLDSYVCDRKDAAASVSVRFLRNSQRWRVPDSWLEV